MKKVILSAFMMCFLMSFTSTKKDIVTVQDGMSCLMWAYYEANKLEEVSPEGAYSWDIETWNWIFQSSFRQCEDSGIPI